MGKLEQVGIQYDQKLRLRQHHTEVVSDEGDDSPDEAEPAVPLATPEVRERLLKDRTGKDQ